MVGIGINLPLKLCQRQWLYSGAGRIRIAKLSCYSVDLWIYARKRAQHVIERAVLHHQDDNVFEIVKTGRHGVLLR
jgi:hypothetical protein